MKPRRSAHHLRSVPESPHRSGPGQGAVRRNRHPTQGQGDPGQEQGTLVDATIIASASEGDDEARWVKHKGRVAVYGFKAHVDGDADTALVEEIAITPANVNDGKAGPQALPDEPGEVFADSAYRGKIFREAVHAKGGRLGVATTGVWIETRRKPWRVLRLGTGRSTAFVAASKKSSERGSEATAFDACAGEGSQRRVCKSASPPSLIISNATAGSRRSLTDARNGDRQPHSRQSAPPRRNNKEPQRAECAKNTQPRTGLLVAQFDHSEGYKLFSLIRASFVVKCHSATAWVLFRWRTQASTSVMIACLSGMRRSRHCEARTPSSDSAKSSQEPCFGV